MSANRDRAFEIIHQIVKEWPEDDVPGVVTDTLYYQGFLMPDGMEIEYGVRYPESFGKDSWGLDLEDCKNIVRNLEGHGLKGQVIARHVSPARNITVTEEPVIQGEGEK